MGFCFKNDFTNELNKILQLGTWDEKTVYGGETQWLSGKEKVINAAVSKNGHADSFLEHERTHHNWFPSKRWNCKQCFLLPNHLSRFIYWIILLYIYIYIYIWD